MYRIFIGRIICVVTVLLMVTGFSFSMSNVKEVKSNPYKIKKLTFSISEQQEDIEPYTYTEIEEVEDFEELNVIKANYFDCFQSSYFQVIENNYAGLTKIIFNYCLDQSDFNTPKWLSLKKIII
jgi:hypothetical protein